MTTRTKTLGVAAAIAAIAVSIPTAVTAYADDPVPPAPAPAPASAVSTPAAPVPDPQGPGCDDFKKALTAGGGSLAGLMALNASTAIASIPQASTFNSAISGGLNPGVNVVSVLDNGPYNVFIPTNDAFAKLDPAELETLKADPAALTGVLYYHMALGVLGPDDIHGKLTTQQGKQITVTGKGGDIKFDDTAKVVCGGITGANSKIYLIDTVLSPSNALASTATTTTSPTSTSTSAESAAPNAEVAPSPSAVAPSPSAAPAPAA